MSKSEELIACLEGEIAKRDETIARLEADNRSKNGSLKAFGEQIAGLQKAVRNRERLVGLRDARIVELESGQSADMFLTLTGEITQLRAELAAIKAQGAVIEADDLAQFIREIDGNHKMGAGVLAEHIAEHIAESIYAAPVSEAKAQGVVMPDVNAAAKALCNRHAMICGVDVDDQWKQYSQDFIADAETVLANARLNAATVQHVSVPDASTDFSQFLSAVMDAAGLVRHGRRSKELSEYLGSKCMEYRGFAAPAAPAADAGAKP